MIFTNLCRPFPRVVGVLNGLHIKCYLPNNREKMSYYNYKKHFSMHLLAVCLPDLRFSYVFAGWPGNIMHAVSTQFNKKVVSCAQITAV